MRSDNEGEFWGRLAIGAVVGFIGGVVDQIANNDWSKEAWMQTAVSTIEGALTSVVGPVAGAIVSGIAGSAESAIDGNNSQEILKDALISSGISLAGSGLQLFAGHISAKKFINNTSKTKLKTFANSLGYTGRNYKSSSLWEGKILLEATKKFSQKTLPQFLNDSATFFMSRIKNAYS